MIMMVIGILNLIKVTIMVIAEIKVVKMIVVNKNLDGNEDHERNLRCIKVTTVNQLKTTVHIERDEDHTLLVFLGYKHLPIQMISLGR